MTLPINTDHPMRDILAGLAQLAQQEVVQVRDVMAGFGGASFIPALIVPAILVVSPLSGIPLFSSVMGLTIALIATQMLLRLDHLWLPGFVLRRQIAGARLGSAVARIGRLGGWIDRMTAPRLSWLMRRPLVWIPQMLCVVCGLAMPMLELVPFSSSLLGLTVICLSVGLLARDGVFVVVGGCIAGVASLIPFFVVDQLTGG